MNAAAALVVRNKPAISTLSCPDCGAPLKRLTKACDYCGAFFFFFFEDDVDDFVVRTTGNNNNNDAAPPPAEGELVAIPVESEDVVLPGCMINLCVTAHTRLVITRLILRSEHVRRDFVVHYLDVGRCSVLGGAGGSPPAPFSGDAFGPDDPYGPPQHPVPIEARLLPAGGIAQLRVENRGLANLRFSAELHGHAAPLSEWR